MSKKDNTEIIMNHQPFSKQSIFSPLQSVSVETNIRNDNDSSQINEFFGLEETGVQTDLTNRDIDELFRSKLCGLGQQELLEFLKAEEQFYQNCLQGKNELRWLTLLCKHHYRRYLVLRLYLHIFSMYIY